METEIKLSIPTAEQGRSLFKDGGLIEARPRALETNLIFDFPNRSLRKASHMLRLRRMGDESSFTFKGAPQEGKYRAREELEIAIGDAATLETILDRLGFQPVFQYEKYRTEFRFPAPEGLATLDETPIGIFLELEGSPEWIDRTAAVLGFDESQYITLSYGALYLKHCAEHGLHAGNMLFPKAGALRLP